MTLPDKNSNELQKKFSRGRFLRDSAIAASGIVLFPSIISGCKKPVFNPGYGHGHNSGVELTQNDLKNAADNLDRMRHLLVDLYNDAYKYDEIVFKALASTKENGNWNNFIVDLFIDIAIGMASAAAIGSGNPEVMPAIAGLSAFLHDWGIGKDRPDFLNGLNGFFAGYQDGQLKMALSLDAKLGHLTDENYPANDYNNLKEAWKDPIVFNGATYTLADLANSYFPEKTHNADEYYKIFNSMYDHHRKSVWNLAIIKCCSLYENYKWWIDTPNESGQLLKWAREEFYSFPGHKGQYVRGKFHDIWFNGDQRYEVTYWNLGIGGYPFPEAASDILFMDDTPYHIINPDGLFNRQYVFQQFNTKKPNFSAGHELGYLDGFDYGPHDDWDFTGGFFPRLAKI